MNKRLSKQQLIERMLRKTTTNQPATLAPKMNTDMFPAPYATRQNSITDPAPEPEEQVLTNLRAFVEVGLSHHPLQCFRYTIYDLVRS
jgi:hypothetical protein